MAIEPERGLQPAAGWREPNHGHDDLLTKQIAGRSGHHQRGPGSLRGEWPHARFRAAWRGSACWQLGGLRMGSPYLDRQRAGEGMDGSVRVDLGGWRIIK